MTPQYRRVISLSFALCINSLAYSMVYPFLPLYLHSERGYSLAMVGIVFPAMGLATIIGSPIAGGVADRIGRRKILLFGPFGRSLCFWALALMAHFQAPLYGFVILLFFAALVGTFFGNAANAYVTDLVPPNERTGAFSTMRVGQNAGWMTGPAIGAFLAETPFSLLFGLTAALCLLTPAMIYFFCPAVTVHHASPGSQRRGSSLKILMGDRRLLGLLSLSFLLFLSSSQFISTLSVFAKEELRIDKNLLGLLFTINGAIVIFFQLPINRLLKRIPLNVRVVLGGGFYVLAYIGIGLSATWGQLVVCMIILTLGEIFSLTAILAMVSHLAPLDKIGRYMGAYGLVQGVGWAMGPYFGSLLFEPLCGRPLLLWLILSGGALASAIGFLFLRNRANTDAA